MQLLCDFLMPPKTDQVASEQHTAQLSLKAEVGLEVTTLTKPCTRPSDQSVHYHLEPGLLVGCGLARNFFRFQFRTIFLPWWRCLFFEDRFSRLFAFIYCKEKIRQSILSFNISLIQMLYTRRHFVVAEWSEFMYDDGLPVLATDDLVDVEGVGLGLNASLQPQPAVNQSSLLRLWLGHSPAQPGSSQIKRSHMVLNWYTPEQFGRQCQIKRNCLSACAAQHTSCNKTRENSKTLYYNLTHQMVTVWASILAAGAIV